MALNLCKYGGQPKAGKPATLNVTTGFLCGLFGATHPLCRLFDVGIPTGGGAKTLLQALFKALKALRFLINAEEAIEIGEEGEIETEAFCKVYPADIELEDITYLDVVSALTIFDNGELMRKLSKIVYIQLWSDNCECKAKRDDADGDVYPIPLPPLPDPTDKCYQAILVLRQLITQANNDRAIHLACVDAYPDEVFRSDPYDSSSSPDLVNGYPAPFWLPPGQAGDADGCMCFVRVTSGERFYWNTALYLNGVIISENNPSFTGYFTGFALLEWCRPPEPPEIPEPVDIFDPDFLENFCDLFPEVEACEKCDSSEHQEIDVPFQTRCDEEAVITWGIDVARGSE